METTAVISAQTGIDRRTTKSKHDLIKGRLARELKTMSAMVHIFCRDHHHTAAGLCPDCREFLDYSGIRLQRCRFGEQKPTCANCPVHCYQRARREQARIVMRYAGPRMVWEHPVLSICHWLDGFRRARGGRSLAYGMSNPSNNNGPQAHDTWLSLSEQEILQRRPGFSFHENRSGSAA